MDLQLIVISITFFLFGWLVLIQPTKQNQIIFLLLTVYFANQGYDTFLVGYNLDTGLLSLFLEIVCWVEFIKTLEINRQFKIVLRWILAGILTYTIYLFINNTTMDLQATGIRHSILDIEHGAITLQEFSFYHFLSETLIVVLSLMGIKKILERPVKSHVFYPILLLLFGVMVFNIGSVYVNLLKSSVSYTQSMHQTLYAFVFEPTYYIYYFTLITFALWKLNSQSS